MTTRSRRATQEGTGVVSGDRRRVVLGTPPAGATSVPTGIPTGALPGAARGESWEIDTEITPRPPPAEQATPTELTARVERSEPIEVEPIEAKPSEPFRVISMKDQAAARAAAEPRVPLHVQLRTMAEVAGLQESNAGLGHLAPPRDPRQVRQRHRRANLAWALVAIALAGGIALVIWLIAGR